MKNTVIVLFVITIHFAVYGQYDRVICGKSYLYDDTTFFQGERINQIDSNGLRIGKWIELYYDDDSSDSLHINDRQYMFQSFGYYKILEVEDTMEYFNAEKRGFGFVSKKGELTQYFDRKGNYISVEDGIWIIHKNLEKIDEIREFSNGKLLTTYSYDNSRIVETNKLYRKGNMRCRDNYRGNTNYVYRRECFSDDGEMERSYFPDCLIASEDINIYFNTTIGDTDTTSLKIFSNSSFKVRIENVFCTSNHVLVFNSEYKKFRKTFLNPHDTLELFLIYKPERDSLISNSHLKVLTKEANCNQGLNISIFCMASEINRRNINSIKEIIIESGEKKHIYIQNIQWDTFVKIFNVDSHKLILNERVSERSVKKINLNELSKGTYLMKLKDGSNEYKIDLIIK